MSRTFIIGSRGSKLALWQAEHVRQRLEASRPGVSVRIEIIKTSGDISRDVSLSVIGGQGAFTKEIEHALLDERVDIAVHSLKDLPTVLADGLALAAITEREDVRDALVLPASALPLFASAYETAHSAGETYLAADAAHMAALAAGGPEESLGWTRRGLELAERDEGAA